MSNMSFLGQAVTVYPSIFDTLIVGTGAAAYNAAIHLFDRGVSNIALLTEDRFGGTSRNTGSDKQTYYKVACAGTTPDTPRAMAATLFSGGSMDGDIALCEAAHSLQEFFHLVGIGVAFPHNRYGEFAGYKTDHDPLERASSTGPYTSRQMTERLEAEACRRNIRLIDKTRVIKLLTSEGDNMRAYGVLCLERENVFCVYLARYIIFATGGPAGLYRETVYPHKHFGASGVLAREGVEFANITEWQYGIGSTKFRWNLSGSYQQVIPRYVAIDTAGREQEFLRDYFPTTKQLSAAVFLKGYQWPFDPAKLGDEGSSLIDCAVYREKYLNGRRVYLDFMHNPAGDFSLDTIDQTAYTYLARSDALAATPVERLQRLNPQAYQLYQSHGIDPASEYIEIDVLPQHHNGGVAVNIWWETSIKRLFAIGECAGTHGVRRPGGSALNAGQVGGLRAAEYIAWNIAAPDTFFENTGAVVSQVNNSLASFEWVLGRVVSGTADAAMSGAIGAGRAVADVADSAVSGATGMGRAVSGTADAADPAVSDTIGAGRAVSDTGDAAMSGAIGMGRVVSSTADPAVPGTIGMGQAMSGTTGMGRVVSGTVADPAVSGGMGRVVSGTVADLAVSGGMGQAVADAADPAVSGAIGAGRAVSGTALSADELLRRLQSLNSATVSFLRLKQRVVEGLASIKALEREPLRVGNGDLTALFCFKETLVLSRLLYETILFYMEQGGKSRGSYLILDALNTGVPHTPELDAAFHNKVLRSRYDPCSGAALIDARLVRPIPDADTWFERVWHDYTAGFTTLPYESC
ncbi:MAG: FAD-binding protein [Treponema sp.]|jgi:succinate dehydrogenase/fumarate reductase flavoprotein subunit|nr:FAD-binding protein [Treponema sp.]